MLKTISMNIHHKVIISLIVLVVGATLFRELQAREHRIQSQSTIVVSVTGDVLHPGLIRLPPHGRRVHAIEACGGLTRSGDLSQLELARPLTDGENLHVDLSLPTTVEKVASPMPARPAPKSLASSNLALQNPQIGEPLKPGERVELNSCTVTDLERIPGIGPTLALRIHQKRSELPQQCFRRLEDLTAIRGISSKTIGRLSHHLKIEGP